MNRRSLLGGAALAATTALVIRQSKASHVPHRRPRLSHVAVLRCDRYERAPQVVEQGLQLVRPSVHGKRVLLKPNLVETGCSLRDRGRRPRSHSGHGPIAGRKRSASAG